MRAEYPDAGVARGWVLPNVGEVQIERHENSPLSDACLQDSGVWLSDQALLVDRFGVVTEVGQKSAYLVRKVLIEFEPFAHPRHLGGRDWDETLARQIRCVRDRRRDVSRL